MTDIIIIEKDSKTFSHVARFDQNYDHLISWNIVYFPQSVSFVDVLTWSIIQWNLPATNRASIIMLVSREISRSQLYLFNFIYLSMNINNWFTYSS